MNLRHSSLICAFILAGPLNACKTSHFTQNAPKTRHLASPVVSSAPAPRIIKSTPLAADTVLASVDGTLPAALEPVVVSEPEAVIEPSPAPEPVLVKEPEPLPVPDPEPAPAPIPAPLPEAPKPTFEVRNERFTQTAISGKADILIVVDNSVSMAQEQKNLSSKLNSLIGDLKDADWQIGIITTTVKVDKGADVCELTLIKSTDADRMERFAKAVQAGTRGSANEEGLRQAVNGLRCPQLQWVRPNSTVVVLILSDEDNCSNGKGCNGGWASENWVIGYVEYDLARVVGVNAGFFGIFYPPAQKCSSAGNKSVIYQRLVDYKANGQINYGNICDASYQPTLEKMSSRIAKLLTNRFQLRETPNAGTLVVKGVGANGNPIQAGDYSLEGNSLTFRFGGEPALNSDLEVEYRVPAKN